MPQFYCLIETGKDLYWIWTGGFGRMDKKILPWKKSLDRIRMRIYCKVVAHHNYTRQNLVRHLPNRGFVLLFMWCILRLNNLIIPFYRSPVFIYPFKYTYNMYSVYKKNT
jgi:hypothetical protein